MNCCKNNFFLPEKNVNTFIISKTLKLIYSINKVVTEPFLSIQFVFSFYLQSPLIPIFRTSDSWGLNSISNYFLGQIFIHFVVSFLIRFISAKIYCPLQRHNDSQGKKLKTVEKEANVAHKPNSRADLSKKRNY